MDSTITSGAWTGHLGRGLAPRELHCTLAVAQGFTAKQIAKSLGIAPGTVTKRLASAMFKLDVNRQAALVAEAMRRNIISPMCLMLATLIAIHATGDDIRRDRKPVERRDSSFEMKLARKGSSKARPLIAIAA